MRVKTLVVPFLLIVALFLASCAPAASPASTPAPASPTAKPAAVAPTAAPAVAPTAAKPAPAPVKIGVTGTASDAGVYIAKERGYFADQGLNADVILFQSLADTIAAMSTGDLDVGGGGWTVPIPNAIQRSIPIKVVADKGSTPPGFSFLQVTVRKDLYDSGQITQPAQLKGKKIGVSSVASMAIMLAPLLQQANLTLKDVEMVPLSWADMLSAYANKSLDAAIISEPTLSKAVEGGLCVRWKPLSDFHPSQQWGILALSPKFSQNTDAANRFMLAYIKALRDYNGAFVKNQGKSDIINILAKSTGITDLTLYDKMAMPGLNPDGYVDQKGLEWGIQFWLSTGDMKETLAINKVVDNSYVDYAIQKLGKYTK
ncbi:MAG: ABC transporter substrate-binding protein [Dehalococcoidia bacterium]|nr:ABC transporter substrate-binding protein [Dehalococcoidia bacterium]